MAVIFADGFDHYGTGTSSRGRLAAGGFVSVQSNVSVVDTNTRTGYGALYMGAGAGAYARRVIPGLPRRNFGLGIGINPTRLPDVSGPGQWGFGFYSADFEGLLMVTLEPDGSLRFWRGVMGFGTVQIIGGTEAGRVPAGVYTHLEFGFNISTEAGRIECRINGVIEFIADAVDLGDIGTTSFSIGEFGGYTPYNPPCHFDDMFMWDDSSAFNITFLGPQRALTLYPNGEGPINEWAVFGAASAHEAVSERVPDGDLTTITAEFPGDRVEFTIPELPAETTHIAAVVPTTMGKLNDAGAGTLLVEMKNGVSTETSPNIPLTAGYAYHPAVFQVDPATGQPWTRNALASALITLKRGD